MKHALVCFGNEESYGMLFVGGELIKYGQEIKFFDAENDDNIIKNICDWNPDFAVFSPMTTFFPQAYSISSTLADLEPSITFVFGGHHATAAPDIIELESVDVVVRGPIRGAVPKLLNGTTGVITTVPTTPDDLVMPVRNEYYADIPRMGLRYRKVMLSMLGCPFNCSYCSSSSLHRRELFGNKAQKQYFLGRRSIDVIIKEAKVIKEYPTKEIEWVDDDIFTGGKSNEGWLLDFISAWESEIDIPMYISTTSIGVLRTSDKVLERMRNISNCIGMGIQAIREESLQLFNRQWDNEEKIKAAYDRLVSFGYHVNLQAIVGLPIKDVVEDAIETLEGMKRIGEGSIISIYPLQIYPNTQIKKIAIHRGYELNTECSGDTNTGVGGLKFTSYIEKKLRNICKFGTLYVKGHIDDRWGNALSNGGLDYLNIKTINRKWLNEALESSLDTKTSEMLSVARYHDCVIDRLGKDKGEFIFNQIINTTNIRG